MLMNIYNGILYSHFKEYEQQCGYCISKGKEWKNTSEHTCVPFNIFFHILIEFCTVNLIKMYLILLSPLQYSRKGTWNYLPFKEGPTRNSQEPVLFRVSICNAIHTVSTLCPGVFKSGPLFNFLSR